MESFDYKLIPLSNCYVIPQIQLDSCPWKEHKADTGRIYYHNNETKESTWTTPKELAELKGEWHS